MTERPEPRASLARGAQVSGYVVEERIGVGGFGEVFRARQPLIGREVAIKVLHAQYSDDPDAVARFVAEARAVNQISHAGIVEIFDFGRLDDGREFCIMELLVGRTLRDLLRERGRLPLAEALPILRGIADAVDAAHAAGIAHRDLKPDNVFVLDDGRTKLIDFGLAKLMHERDSPVTLAGSVFGTPLYMSPEQCRGGALDTRTDLYSFGVVAYHMLVGEPPFSGDPIELALHHLNDRAEAPSKRCEGLPRYVDHVLLSLLAKDPTDRPASLATAVAALEGSITLRRIRARHVRQLAATAVVVGGLGFGAFELATRTAADPDRCAPASERLRGIWDPSVLAEIDGRFANSPPPGTSASWRSDRVRLGEFAVRWAGQWDAACHAPDRVSDPLLYAQRSTCLENTLLGLQGMIRSFTTMDLAHYETADSGFVSYDGRTFADCESPAVLRAQVAAPPPGVRERVKALLLDTYKVSADAGAGANERNANTVDVKVDRLAAIAQELEAIYPPAAASPILARAGVLAGVTWDVASRQPRAREAIADAIRRIAATRDDVMLADAYLLEASFELNDERDGDPVGRGAAALELAAQAIARAGGPREPSASLANLRGRLASDRGESDAAIAAYRAAMADDREGVLGSWPHSEIARTLALAGRDADARTEAQGMITAASARYGDVHSRGAMAEKELAMVLEVAGDFEGALLHQTRYHAIATQLGGPEYQGAWERAWEADLSARLGRISDVDLLAAAHALADHGTTPTKQSSDGLATARRAGHFALFSRAAELEIGTGTDQALDAAAILAFARGDDAAMAESAAKIASRCTAGACADWVRTSRWLAILADAKAHPDRRRGSIDDQLAALEREYDGDRTAAATTGVVLAALGRWDDALVKLEAARAIPNVWERQADLVEVDTWLGLARLRHGDRAGARRSFEEALDALSIWHNGFDGFTYMTPVAELALARILPDAARPRARWLAMRAVAGFARLGPHRDPDRADAATWLAEHPLI